MTQSPVVVCCRNLVSHRFGETSFDLTNHDSIDQARDYVSWLRSLWSTSEGLQGTDPFVAVYQMIDPYEYLFID